MLEEQKKSDRRRSSSNGETVYAEESYFLNFVCTTPTRGATKFISRVKQLEY